MPNVFSDGFSVAAKEVKDEKEESSDEEEGGDAGSKHSRSELKARKVCLFLFFRIDEDLGAHVIQALLKLGLKAVPGINRVTIKKSKTVSPEKTHQHPPPSSSL